LNHIGCLFRFSYAGGDIHVAWARAERYAHTILSDLSAGSNGWIEWNMILDAIGGPNHLGNLCDSPLLAVPYRAANADKESVPKLMPWQLSKSPFGPIIGDGRTKEELHALGFSAEFLDVGVVVQPMYYYMGHISRHVRPGSEAVNALVESSLGNKGEKSLPPTRTFRPHGQRVAGGGINNLAKNGIEVTLWPCEGSTRQEWKFDTNSNQLQVFGHDWLGKPTSSCLSRQVDASFEGLILTDCNVTLGGDPGSFIMEGIEGDDNDDDDDDEFFEIRLTTKDMGSKKNRSCLYVKPLENNGGAYGERGGAQVAIGLCSQNAAMWKFNSSTSGEIISYYFRGGTDKDININNSEVCLTTGWPFLQVGAYITPMSPDGSKTVVILNEAAETANYVIKNENSIVATASIPSHSIQTVIFD